MVKIVMVVAPENYRDEEFNEPKRVFLEKGFEVVVASKEVSEAKGMLGGSTQVNVDVYDVKDFDALVFVGGSGASIYFEDNKVLDIAKDAYDHGKVLGAICIAPSILANAGLLNGKKCTCFSSEEGNVKEKGAEFTGNDVEVDGKIVTANGPKAAKEFGEKIVSLINLIKG